MRKNWKYVVRNLDNNIMKGTITDSDMSASEICRDFERQGLEVLSLSCLASFPFMKFINPERRNFTYA